MKELPVKSISEIDNVKTRLFGMNEQQIMELLTQFDEPKFRGQQILEWLYARNANSFGVMSNIAKSLQEKLATHTQIGREDFLSCSESPDGTKKYLYPAGTGRFIETAYIPDDERATLCLSTQAGCKMGCLFCATARQGFQGNLDAGRIVNQYASLPQAERGSITNLVYMGMGEPMDNIEAVLQSLAIFTHKHYMNLSAHRITVSTIGVLPGLERFVLESKANLAISLHSPYDEERRHLMPIQQVYPIADIIEFLAKTSWSGSRRLSFEYIMFQGVNDSLSHAKELVRLLNKLSCRVNLIHYHHVDGNTLTGSPYPVMEQFQLLLKEKGIMTTIRRSRGEDIQAACGLLSTREMLAIQTPDSSTSQSSDY